MNPDTNRLVELRHGAGGRHANELVETLFVRAFDSPHLACLNDQATLSLRSDRIAFSTDSFVVDPLFFPGGNIGDLAVNGTVNDLAMGAAIPRYLSTGFIIEEGMPIADLEIIVESMRVAAHRAGVEIVTGDTKVVARGQCDRLYINTSGIGIVEHRFSPGADRLVPGDKILLSGTIAEHGMAVLIAREQLPFEHSITSDTAPLHELARCIMATGGESVHVMRDATRGGVATVLNELAKASGVSMEIRESLIPLRSEVAGACDLLGIDPLGVANEGKLIACVAPPLADKVLTEMRALDTGHDAVCIGEVTSSSSTGVTILTSLGATRILPLPSGDQMPRIC